MHDGWPGQKKEGFAVDASIIPADANEQRSIPTGEPIGTNGAATLRHSRAVVAFAAAPKGLLGLAPPDPCRGADAALEVYDLSTGGSLFLSPGVISGFNPQPDPPGIVGR
ncbi:MAG: hypothetical protein JWR07_3658 [Nevskia sp.]|nr:hypothetical protein [Nevskia sp.]